MKKTATITLGILFCFSLFAQESNSEGAKAITKLLNTQAESWNRGDLEGFMQTYWKSDSLMFIGKSGIKWGWQNTLNNYKKGYPDTTAMGKLHFKLLQTKKLSPQYYFVVGGWYLKRSMGDLSGHFTLLLKKIRGRWVIVADHSS